MGFFKDLLKLRRMSKDWEDDYDVAAALADAKRQMASATDALQAAAGAVDLAGGERATAQVTATRTTGMLVNRSPMLQIDLMVFRVGYPPYPATATMSSASGMPAPGQRLSVLVDRDEPTRIAIG